MPLYYNVLHFNVKEDGIGHILFLSIFIIFFIFFYFCVGMCWNSAIIGVKHNTEHKKQPFLLFLLNTVLQSIIKMTEIWCILCGKQSSKKWKWLHSIDSSLGSLDISHQDWHFPIHKMWHLVLQMHHPSCKSSYRETVQCHFSQCKLWFTTAR